MEPNANETGIIPFEIIKEKFREYVKKNVTVRYGGEEGEDLVAFQPCEDNLQDLKKIGTQMGELAEYASKNIQSIHVGPFMPYFTFNLEGNTIMFNYGRDVFLYTLFYYLYAPKDIEKFILKFYLEGTYEEYPKQEAIKDMASVLCDSWIGDTQYIYDTTLEKMLDVLYEEIKDIIPVVS